MQLFLRTVRFRNYLFLVKVIDLTTDQDIVWVEYVVKGFRFPDVIWYVTRRHMTILMSPLIHVVFLTAIWTKDYTYENMRTQVFSDYGKLLQF